MNARVARGAAMACRRRRAGFTLLEMVVVLAIMGLVIGVASIRIFSMIESWRVRAQLDDIVGQFAHLPVVARQRGADIVLPPPAASVAQPAAGSPDEAPGFRLPDDWKITFDQPLRVRSNGFCEGARIVSEHEGRAYPRRVTAPFCQVTVTEGAP
ncbi:MAG TPA: type II secretion system protein [Dyella sp.]|nr:type II secretion system protein [Dyella sp.]